MVEVLRERLNTPRAWRGADIQGDASWVIQLTRDEVVEIDAALHHVSSLGLEIPFTAAEFPLPTLAARLNDVPEHLENGPGFVLIRGLPGDMYSPGECAQIYWGLGVHIGTPVSQNSRGHLLGHVRDEGLALEAPHARAYQTRGETDFHSDQLPVDVLGMFCVRTARSGGASMLASVETVHNVILEERPDLLDVLYQPFTIDWCGEEPAGERPWFRCPMLSCAGGKVTSRLTNRAYCDSVARFGDGLALTNIQREALDFVQAVAHRPELRLRMHFAEGDIQFINNHAVLHAREAYEDFDDPMMKRYLLRMWISLPPARRRQLAPILAERCAFVERGGIPRKAA